MQADAIEQVGDTRGPLILGAERLGVERLAHAPPDGPAGIERAERILEYGLDAASEDLQVLPAGARDVDIVEHDPTGGGIEQSEDATSERALARSRFADHREHLAGLHLQIDACDRVELRRASEHARLHREPLHESLDPEERPLLPGDVRRRFDGGRAHALAPSADVAAERAGSSGSSPAAARVAFDSQHAMK